MKQGQNTEQVLQQIQTSNLQIQLSTTIAMNAQEIEARIQRELDENPALVIDTESEYYIPDAQVDGTDAKGDDSSVQQGDYEDVSGGDDDRREAEDDHPGTDADTELLPRYDTGTDDEIYNYIPDEVPEYQRQQQYDDSDRREQQIVGGETLYDRILAQVQDLDLGETESEVMTYLIGSLDDRGYLTRDTDTIVDELAFGSYIYVTREDVDRLIAQLQTFEPTGIAAHDERECLLLQMRARYADAKATHSPTLFDKRLALKVLEDYYDPFIHRRWSEVASALEITDEAFEHVVAEIRHLSLRPAGGMNEYIHNRAETVIPDFGISVDDYGEVHITQTDRSWLALRTAQSYEDTMRQIQRIPLKSRTREQAETLNYTTDLVNRSKVFIELIRRRSQTLSAIVAEIVRRQRPFFASEDDETLLSPLTRQQVADALHVDTSTVSRATTGKYLATAHKTYALSYFFSTGFTSSDGDEVAARQVRLALQEIIPTENPRKPYSDLQLVELLASRGLTVARRTIAKYREALGIPSSSKRRTK